MTTITLLRQDILDDIADAAFVVADIAEGDRDHHSLHQTYDICEDANTLRVNHLIDLAFAEALLLLRPLLDSSRPPVATESSLSLTLKPHPFFISHSLPNDQSSGGFVGCRESVKAFHLRETLREYLLSYVLTHWLRVTLPQSAPPWETRLQESSRHLRSTITLTRPLSPW